MSKFLHTIEALQASHFIVFLVDFDYKGVIFLFYTMFWSDSYLNCTFRILAFQTNITNNYVTIIFSRRYKPIFCLNIHYFNKYRLFHERKHEAGVTLLISDVITSTTNEIHLTAKKEDFKYR